MGNWLKMLIGVACIALIAVCIVYWYGRDVRKRDCRIFCA